MAAVIYLIPTGGVVMFQLALALGVPWESCAMGGAFPGFLVLACSPTVALTAE